jgi:selenium metabolism protein YedF
MEYIDLRGMSCPVPVIETKKLLESKDVKEIEVLLDNPASSENVKRFLESKGFATVTTQEGDIYRIKGVLDEKGSAVAGVAKKLLVYIDGETMGKGNDELGKVLVRAFLNTLKELETKPWRLIFINTGVKLVSRESEYIGILKEIKDSGVEILSCGTCLDFFNLKEKIGVGRISNMFEILSSFSESTHVIRL